MNAAFLTRILIEILEEFPSNLNSKVYKIPISGFGPKPLSGLLTLGAIHKRRRPIFPIL